MADTRSRMSLQSLWACFAVLVVGWTGLATRAQADPITFSAQPPLARGGIMVVQRARVNQATDGPGPEDANETTLRLTTMVVAAPHARLTLSAELDYLRRSTDVQLPTGERIERNAAGVGDVSLRVASCYSSWLLGGRLVASPFVSVKIPTGADNASDRFGRLPQQIQVGTGAFDFGGGLLASWFSSALEVHGAGSYTLRTKANDYDGGDRFRLDLGAQRCVAPWGGCTKNAARLFAALESRLIWQASDRGRLAPSESGGMSALVAPGIRVQLGRHTIEAAVELPLTQPYEQHLDFAIIGGYRFVAR